MCHAVGFLQEMKDEKRHTPVKLGLQTAPVHACETRTGTSRRALLREARGSSPFLTAVGLPCLLARSLGCCGSAGDCVCEWRPPAMGRSNLVHRC